MPAYPVWSAIIAIVRERKLRLLHQVVVRLIDVGRGAVRITESQVHTGWIGWCSAGRDSKRRHKVCEQRVGIWTTVIRVLIVNLVFEDREGTLLGRPGSSHSA